MDYCKNVPDVDAVLVEGMQVMPLATVSKLCLKCFFCPSLSSSRLVLRFSALLLVGKRVWKEASKCHISWI